MWSGKAEEVFWGMACSGQVQNVDRCRMGRGIPWADKGLERCEVTQQGTQRLGRLTFNVYNVHESRLANPNSPKTRICTIWESGCWKTGMQLFH